LLRVACSRSIPRDRRQVQIRESVAAVRDLEPSCPRPRFSVDVNDALTQECLAAADQAFSSGGVVRQPQIHLLVDGWEQPQLGPVLSRLCRQDLDPVDAITRLREAPHFVVDASGQRATRDSHDAQVHQRPTSSSALWTPAAAADGKALKSTGASAVSSFAMCSRGRWRSPSGECWSTR